MRSPPSEQDALLTQHGNASHPAPPVVSAAKVSKAGQWPVLDLSAADAPDVCALFEAVFGHPMSAAFQAWKYADGRGMATGMRDDAGRLVAHYGGTLRVMQWGGTRFTGAQVGDVMVATQVRDVFARFGPFGRVARQFIQQYLGTGRPYPIGFGFPNARHVLLGRRLGLYWPVTQVLAWHWTGAALCAQTQAQPMPPTTYQALDMAHADDRAQVDRWADDMAASFTPEQMLWPVRGGDWWRHRYTHHPHFTYQVHAVCPADACAPSGALVLKVTPSTGTWELMDWVGALPFCQEVLAHATAICTAAQGTGLDMWCTEAVAAHLPAHWTQSATQSVACEVVVNDDHLLGQPIAPLRHSFWLTGGDTDFH
jgi:Acetyltransferase (GNAT) domain